MSRSGPPPLCPFKFHLCFKIRKEAFVIQMLAKAHLNVSQSLGGGSYRWDVTGNCWSSVKVSWCWGLMLGSSFLVHQPHKLQTGRSPSLLAAFHWGTPPFGRNMTGLRLHRVQWGWPRTIRQTKMAAPIKRWFSLYLCHVGSFSINFNCSFDYIAALIRSQFLHCMVLLCVQYDVKLSCLFCAGLLKRLM